MNPYVTLGAARGLKQGVDDYRERKEHEEDRGERKLELEHARGRRAVAEQQQDETYGYEKEQRPLREEALQTQVEGAKVGLDAARTNLHNAKEDRPGDVAELEAQRGRERTRFDRESELHGIGMQKKRQELADEGLDRFLDTLEAGGDPEYAVKIFNAQGKHGIQPGTIQYDHKSGTVSFTGAGGQKYNGSVEQLRAALPQKPLVKFGKDDRLYDPNKKRVVVGPNGPGGLGGGPNGKRSPFNYQTHIKRAQDLTIAAMGYEYDNQMQKFKIPAGSSERVAYANSLVDQVARQFDEEGLQVGPGEISNVVMQSMRGVKTSSEAMKMAKGELGDNVGESSLNLRAQEIMDQSKIVAAQTLRQETQMMRQQLQSQQNSQQYPTPPDPSEDMQGGGDGMETPPPDLLREGYTQQFQDGSVWTLKNGVPKRVQ